MVTRPKTRLSVVLLGLLLAGRCGYACTATVSITIQADLIAHSEDSSDFKTVTLSWGSCPENAVIAFAYGGNGLVHLHESDGGDLQEHGGVSGSVTLLAEGFTASTELPGASLTAQAVIMQTPPDPPTPVSAPSTASAPVVGVASPLKYQEGLFLVEINDAMFIMKDTQVTFKATPSVGVTWAKQPTWKFGETDKGQGETKQITFTTKGQTTVSASTGKNAVTVNVTVYALTARHVADYWFNGRATIKYGACEKANLDFTVDPPGITPAQMGGLVWSRSQGSGVVTNTGLGGKNGTGEFYSPVTAFNVTLRLTVDEGPCRYRYAEADFTVIPPSGTRMTRVNPNQRYHRQWCASVGMSLYYWLDPKDVSFHNVGFGESVGLATNVTGYFARAFGSASYPDGGGLSDHLQNSFTPPAPNMPIMGGNVSDGCRVFLPDYAGTVDATPYEPGTYTWSIPTQYGVYYHRYTFGTPQTQTGTYDSNGTATISKGGQQASAGFVDDDSEW